MEEDLKILEEFCKHGGYKSNGLPVAFIEIPYTVLKQAIQNLIARYKKLEARSDRINQQNIEYQKTLEQLQKDTIWKSKVKEKIEELYKEYEKISKENFINKNETQKVLNAQIVAYKKLLED